MKVFGNPIAPKVVRGAQRKARQYQKKFGDDSNVEYPLKAVMHPLLGGPLGLWDIHTEVNSAGEDFDRDKGVIIGNIRMGFGHYRIAMAMASCANALGYKPYWFDLHSYPQTTGGKIIGHLNGLYSMGSRWSQQSKLFNHLYWEPLNRDGFRKLSYHISDWYATQLMTPIFSNLPKEIPFIGTHVWPAQAAVHAKMDKVINAIPDNWPMALHLAPGSLHTVQTPSSYWGYRMLNGMQGDAVLQPMPEEAVVNTGHYIDAELLENLNQDNQRRRQRMGGQGPLRLLLTVGGAGAQFPLFRGLIEALIPAIKKQEVALFINVGDHLGVWEKLVVALPELKTLSRQHFDQWDLCQSWITSLQDQKVDGIHAFYHKDIFSAVYSTNLLMREADLMLTKPSELAFYPIPKLMLPRVGGHEAWGAIRAAELGDGTPEALNLDQSLAYLKTLLENPKTLIEMVDNIDRADAMGVYDGAYRVVQLAKGDAPVGRPNRVDKVPRGQ